jgi:hypothetical protein
METQVAGTAMETQVAGTAMETQVAGTAMETQVAGTAGMAIRRSCWMMLSDRSISIRNRTR